MLAAAAMFAYAPIAIANAPFESTMGLVQKIFYFHVPSWFAMFTGAFICGIASAVFLFKGSRRADHYAVSGAEIAVLFGMIGLITGPLWARKSWGVWWQWDAKLTLALIVWLTFVAYLLLRRYGGPGSEKLAAGVGLFGMANIPFVYYSVNWWRTIHPKTSVVPTLGPGMRGTFWFCVAAFLVLTAILVAARVRLERQRELVDELYLSLED
jgi:heme exporter protein C